ncbi:hypothetical protein A2U01_0093542 [Trifolium medium]|uniref:Uncharacterized protein n=1 Tax=Trifolium medium TaxID=97028 RepID=A0A392UFF8_9FABA|nr:hypothetical protein [Trifolium medium]
MNRLKKTVNRVRENRLLATISSHRERVAKACVKREPVSEPLEVEELEGEQTDDQEEEQELCN